VQSGLSSLPVLGTAGAITTVPARGSKRIARRSSTSPHKESLMNWDRIEGNWKQFKGNVKEQWGKLTDDQIDVINGRRDQLAGRIQETYGLTKEEAEQQVKDWEAGLK
jgi:uncharacterized protein YjbJ (UPF0337 family)